jgi:hypothetical protein
MRRVWAPQFIASLMLLWALNSDNPYGYYILLRWVCCGVFAFLAFKAFGQEQQGWAWVLGITAAIYNPIFRVHLTREVWTVVNLITIGIAVASIFAINFSEEKRGSGHRAISWHCRDQFQRSNAPKNRSPLTRPLGLKRRRSGLSKPRQHCIAFSAIISGPDNRLGGGWGGHRAGTANAP